MLKKLLALLLVLTMLLTGCSMKTSDGEKKDKEEASQSEDGGKSDNKKDKDDKKDKNDKDDKDDEDEAYAPIPGEDVFDGERFNEMLWGYYEADCYESTGSRSDAEEFLKDMEFITMELQNGAFEFSALPLSLELGKYTHFMSSFRYEGEYYNAFTEKGKAMFRKAYMEEVGDLTEEDFLRIEKIFQLDVAQMTFALEDGSARYVSFAYELDDDQINFYTLDIDDSDYTITLGEDPILQCKFLHDGGKLTLAYKNIQRSYQAYGYKPTQKSLEVAGYAYNEKNQYEDLEGFTMYQFGKDSDISVYVSLANDESPVDPVMELDTETGSFTLSWEERWVVDNRGTQKQSDPTAISGTLIPITGFASKVSGFVMIVDGQMYKYLMSEEEYEERKLSAIENAEDLTTNQVEDLNNAKRNILEELVAAFRAAGIEVDVDYTTGKVSLASNFLFASGSYELSADGKAYLDAFMGVYTSVVMKEDYAGYISQIIVEGHTDTSGSYSYNLELSRNRAESVAQQCIAHTPALEEVLRSVGYAYDYPVYNDDGTVDMEQSRRVTFTFILSAR